MHHNRNQYPIQRSVINARCTCFKASYLFYNYTFLSGGGGGGVWGACLQVPHFTHLRNTELSCGYWLVHCYSMCLYNIDEGITLTLFSFIGLHFEIKSSPQLHFKIELHPSMYKGLSLIFSFISLQCTEVKSVQLKTDIARLLFHHRTIHPCRMISWWNHLPLTDITVYLERQEVSLTF